MTMDALYRLADRSAELGMNAILMEWEGSFPFKENATLCKKEAYTEEEVCGFVDYCSSKGIEVIPLQNCFGHCEYILRHERYSVLREPGLDYMYSQVCPSRKEEAKEVFTSIFAEIARMHPSQYIHIGCDETLLLGRCNKCKATVEQYGRSKLFVDYVNVMCEIVHSLGKTPVIWSDILVKYPEAVEELPEDLIVMDWNYGWSVNYFGRLDSVTNAGHEVWGAPSLRSQPDNIYTHAWTKHFKNLTDYLPYIKGQGANAIFETSWSTSGIFSWMLDNSDNREVIEMYPLRQCYPLSGFDILIAAFAEATSTEGTFEMDNFIERYCAERFGFNEEECGTMKAYFHLDQPKLNYSEYTLANIRKSLDETLALRRDFSNLRPRYHKEDFAHLALMFDLRVNWLQFKLIDREYESAAGNRDNFKDLHTRLKPVLKEAHILRRRFVSQNRGYLKDPMATIGRQCYINKAEQLDYLLSRH